MKQLEWGFKRRINWNKYQPGTTEESQKLYLDFLITSGFHGEDILFVSSFENKNVRESYKRYFFPTLEIKLTAICKCFYLLRSKRNSFRFLKRNCESIILLFCVNILSI